jgi:hypothetical protein
MIFMRPTNLVTFALGGSILSVVFLSAQPIAAAGGGQLKVTVVDKETGRPLAARMHLKNAAGRTPRIKKVPVLADHFVFDGEIALKLPKGAYRFELECGPEYLDQRGHFIINDFADDEKTLEMRRFVNMAGEGWYSGDLDVHRSPKEIELLMRADDLHLAQILPPAKKSSAKSTAVADGVFNFDTNRCYQIGPSDPPWYDIQRPTAWKLPVLVARGEVDSIEIAGSQLHRTDVADDEKGCKPRDPALFPGSDGVARWGEKVYFHLLNCGLRIPPSAGSGSGDTPNPVGYNRAYVHLDSEFSYEAWMNGLRAGRTVITNGPMIRPTVEGEFPGHVFQADAGQEVELEVGVNLATREKIDYFEIVKNGRVTHSVRLADFKKAGGRLPKVMFKESGWFVLRVVTNNQNTYRFAMTAPYYVEIGYERRISRESVRFFIDWLNEMPGDRDEAAIAWWQKRLKKANAD